MPYIRLLLSVLSVALAITLFNIFDGSSKDMRSARRLHPIFTSLLTVAVAVIPVATYSEVPMSWIVHPGVAVLGTMSFASACQRMQMRLRDTSFELPQVQSQSVSRSAAVQSIQEPHVDAEPLPEYSVSPPSYAESTQELNSHPHAIN